MNALIEKLQDKTYVRAFGLMSAEEQECFRKAEIKNCTIYGGTCGLSGAVWRKSASSLFQDDYTYAINDYQPGPEFVDLEIVKLGCNCLGVNSSDIVPESFRLLYCLPSLPNFELFWYKDTNTIRIDFDVVAKRIIEGKKVYARFR